MPVRGDNTYKTYRTPAQIRNSTTVKARATSLNSAIFFRKRTIATPKTNNRVGPNFDNTGDKFVYQNSRQIINMLCMKHLR